MFLKSLIVKIPSSNQEILDDIALKIEEKNLGFIFEIDEKNMEIAFFKEEFLGVEDISFNNYIEIGGFIKELLISLELTDLKNYKELFSIKKINISENREEKKELFEVPNDDEKLLEAMDFLKKVGKN